MAIALDIIGSLAIRGAIVLIILRLNVSMQQALTLKTTTANVRENLAAMVSVIETDFRQAGYGVTGTVFQKADSNDVIFVADFSNNGSIDTIRIYLDSSNVYRRVNSWKTLLIGSGVTQMKFEYVDITGVTTATDSTITSIKLSVGMEENYVLQELGDGRTYRPSARSTHQFFPQNL
ncbi:MAG TPA: hypothetical protein VII11_02265 [Bacteroidota bacterium]